jgi:sterol desaturase/sphingolipid hydroxylase (fatty acid hydroxylase superfamily)
MKKIIPYLIYPAYVFLGMGLYFGLLPYCPDLKWQIILMASLSSLSFNTMFLHETLFPYKKDLVSLKEKLNDGFQTLIVLPVVAIGISLTMRHLVGSPLEAFWPHSWPLPVQLGLILVIAEWFHYHYHRLTHRKKFLWKLHTIHHAPTSIHTLNSARFHLIDLALNILVYAFPLVLIGAKYELQLAFMLINSITGTLEHVNFSFKGGYLNRIFNTGELHRWHHSENRRESQKNMGKVLSLWDQVYGTYFLPEDREVKAFGLGRDLSSPETFLKQLKEPFKTKVIPATAGMIALLLSVETKASFEGLEGKLETSKIVEISRPCCNFSPHPLLNKVGLFQIADKENLKTHQYNNIDGRDPIGLIYSCQGGFVDIGHLRDNADWTAKILYYLPSWLGTGKTINGRNEGGFKGRNVYFPVLPEEQIASLTQEDLKKIAVAISFSYATLHEIATGFKVAVSVPQTLVMYERASSFSVEDQYSNLLGAYLGAQAALSSSPYNEGMTKLLNQKLTSLKALSPEETSLLHKKLEGKWWQKDVLARFGSVLKRNFGHRGEVTPTLVSDVASCENSSPDSLEVPDRLSNGLSVNDFFRLEANLKNNLVHALEKAHIGQFSSLSQLDFPEIVEKMERWFELELRQ